MRGSFIPLFCFAAELKPPYMESANSMAALYQIALNPAPRLREANWTQDFHEFVEFVLIKEVRSSPVFYTHLVACVITFI